MKLLSNLDILIKVILLKNTSDSLVLFQKNIKHGRISIIKEKDKFIFLCDFYYFLIGIINNFKLIYKI